MHFSVLMSVYKKDNVKWFEEALDSMINQTLLPSEILIMQDGPLSLELDKTIENYINKYSFIRTHKLIKNVGLGLALQEGIKLCKYDLIARMDADDISIPTRFEKQINYFKHHNVDIVGSVIIEFEDNPYTSTTLRKLPETHNENVKFAKKRNPIGHSSVMFKKESVLKAGNYKDYYLVEDYDLWVRMIETGAIFYNFQEPITYMRINKDFYKRRGGIKYYKSIHKFKKELYQKGYLSYKEYFKSNTASLIVTMMPGFIRTFIYKKLLRKKVNRG